MTHEMRKLMEAVEESGLSATNAILCVWPATIVGDKEEEFVAFLKENFGVNGQYATEFFTLPDVDNGVAVPDTGGRNDLLFWVAANDISKFAVPRLGYGIRWWSDYLDNSRNIVPDDILEQYKDAT